MRQSTYAGIYGMDPPDHEYADKPKWLNKDRRFSFPTPTHWMPLPAPPKEQPNEG